MIRVKMDVAVRLSFTEEKFIMIGGPAYYPGYDNKGHMKRSKH